MAATTNPDFGANTESLEVAKVFASNIQGKTILVTGVNAGGIGFTTAQGFASQSPEHLIIASRTPAKMQESIDALKADYPNVNYRDLKIDLSSVHSVRQAATEVLSWSDIPTIDIVVNSAGIMGVQERTITPEGAELHFGTNHIGHWLLACLIMPKLIEAAKKNPKGATRIVNVSSGSPWISGMRWSDMTFAKKNKDLPKVEQPAYEWFTVWGYSDAEMGDMTYIPLDGYNRSKVANVLFGIGANKRLFEKYGIFVTAVHPGVIMTELGRYWDSKTMEAIKKMMEQGTFTLKSQAAGASTSMVAALDPKLTAAVGETHNGSENWGAFLEDCQISAKACAAAVSISEAEKLWKASEKLVGENFEW